MSMDKTECPAHRVGHFYITIGRATFCMDCGKVASSPTGNRPKEKAARKARIKMRHA